MTTDLQQAAARVQELVDMWEKGQIEVYPVITLSPPTIKDCLRTLLGAVEEIERLRAELEILRSALKVRVSNVSEDQILAAWAAWDDCHESPQANDTMRAALEASHLVFLRRTSQIVEASLAAMADRAGGEG